jgi:halocyanin-like protein
MKSLEDTQPGTGRPSRCDVHTCDRARTRRGFIAGLAATVALGSTGVASGQSSSVDGWMSDVENSDGIVDRTGRDEVRVDVGVEANGGAFGFGPAAVRVDPGTTVTWSWTGDGGSHNVVAADGAFASSLQNAPGATFTHTFDTDGVYRYACEPHRNLGMKGVVVVGSATTAAAQSGTTRSKATEQPQAAAGVAGGGGTGGGSGVLATAVGLGLTAVALGSVYLLGWRDRPEPSFRPEAATERAVADTHAGPMYEAEVATAETESVDHDAFDPIGTGTLLAIYFVIIALLWLFMYFVEFLGNGPTVVG